MSRVRFVVNTLLRSNSIDVKRALARYRLPLVPLLIGVLVAAAVPAGCRKKTAANAEAV